MALIDLEKKVTIVLEKRQIANVTAKVALAIDISGSMRDLYRAGKVQEVVDRILAVGCKFDDDRSIDIWLFDDGQEQLDSVTESDFGSYVQKKILDARTRKWGGTNYAPVLHDINRFYYQASTSKPGLLGKLFGSKETSTSIPEGRADANDKFPVFVAFITDGDNYDKGEAERVINQFSTTDTYIQFVGLKDGGYVSFEFLQKMAKKYPNVGFFEMDTSMSDDKLYEQLLSPDLGTFLKSLNG